MNVHKVDVLAIGAHPDDVEFGCGGTLAKLSKLGKTVGIIDLSKSELSTNGTVEERLVEADEARKILGVKYREVLDIPNNFFFNNKEYQDVVIEKIRQYQPEMVFIPYVFDRHPDHENASKIIRDSLFTGGLKMYKTALEKWRPKYVFAYMLWYEFSPSMVVDITETFQTKLDSILAYKSQFKLDPKRTTTIDNNDDTIKYIDARARVYGFHIQKTYGEPFLSLNYSIGVSNPFDLLPNFF
jgi:bacillithiol biosynthesis deacetylase BshB1